MFSKLLVAVFIMLSSVAANAQSSMTVTAANNSVAADVGSGSGFIDFYIPDGNNKNRLSFHQTSFLTVEVNGNFFTNNIDLFANAIPKAPTQFLTNGSEKLLPDKSGSTNDTIRTTWVVSTPDKFQIIQDVYPVPFPVSGSGQIVYKISVVNLTNSNLNAQAQFLFDNEIVDFSTHIANDNTPLATRAGFSPNWETFPNPTFPDIPPFELEFEAELCNTGFPGIIGVGFTDDSLAPEPMGLMTPASLTFVDWPTTVTGNTFGFDEDRIGTAINDAATLIQWPASGAGPNSEQEIARGSYGTQQCGTCEGNLAGMIFHPEHIKWTGANYSPQIFPVEAIIFNPTGSDMQTASATQTTFGPDVNLCPVKIESPLPSTNFGQIQQHAMTPGTIQSCSLGDIIWFDTIDNSLVNCHSDSIYSIQITVAGGGVGQPIFFQPCICPIEVDCQEINFTHPVTSVVSRTGNYDRTECNTRCTDVVAFDSGGIPGGIKSIVGTSLTNMQVIVAPSHSGADSMFYNICVQDSLLDGSATVTITDTSGNVDSEHYTYCTIPDTQAPYIVKVDSGFFEFEIRDDRPWDRGLDSIHITNLVNIIFDSVPPKNLLGADSYLLRGQLINPRESAGMCLQAFDEAGNASNDTCFWLAVDDGVSPTIIEPASFSIFPNPISDNCMIALAGAGGVNANIEIFDVLGREVGHFQLTGSYDWQTGSLPSGTYMLRAIVGNGGENSQSITKRIVKE